MLVVLLLLLLLLWCSLVDSLRAQGTGVPGIHLCQMDESVGFTSSLAGAARAKSEVSNVSKMIGPQNHKFTALIFGGSHSHGGTPIAGWFLLEKIL